MAQIKAMLGLAALLSAPAWMGYQCGYSDGTQATQIVEAAGFIDMDNDGKRDLFRVDTSKGSYCQGIDFSDEIKPGKVLDPTKYFSCPEQAWTKKLYN